MAIIFVRFPLKSQLEKNFSSSHFLNSYLIISLHFLVAMFPWTYTNPWMASPMREEEVAENFNTITNTNVWCWNTLSHSNQAVQCLTVELQINESLQLHPTNAIAQLSSQITKQRSHYNGVQVEVRVFYHLDSRRSEKMMRERDDENVGNLALYVCHWRMRGWKRCAANGEWRRKVTLFGGWTLELTKWDTSWKQGESIWKVFSELAGNVDYDMQRETIERMNGKD